MTLRRMSPAEFVRRLFDAQQRQDRRFAFFLGAGCSVSSGIPAAGALVKDYWLPRLFDLNGVSESGVADWLQAELPNYDASAPAASYGAVIERLFPFADDRQAEIEWLCDGRYPAFGYAVLAALVALDGGRFNVVLTTNFDELVADALYLFTSKRPLVIHHEALAAFIRPTRTRPLVVKLHGDHRLAPQNTASETQVLQESIEQSVRGLLHDRTLVFCGYGGSDTGVARLLESLSTDPPMPGVYWVNAREPDRVIRPWLEARGAIWVTSESFDDLMVLVRDTFGFPHPDRGRLDTVFQQYLETYEELASRLRSAQRSGGHDATALLSALERTDRSFTDWWAVEMEARKHKINNPDEADRVYKRGVEEFPSSAPLIGNYALFLATQRRRDEAQRVYEQAISLDPKHATNLSNYASFLIDIRGDPDKAESLCRQALDADPGHAGALANYASLLAWTRADYRAAEVLFQRALKADPRLLAAVGGYARLLHEIKGDLDGAEAQYRRALIVAPEHPTVLGNYANLLLARGDVDGAEMLYRRAVDADPNHANALTNYANLLSNIRGDLDTAESLYARAVDAAPGDAFAAGNYAVFLQTRRGDVDKAEVLFRRAIEAAPQNAPNLSNYANFLLAFRGDPDGAEVHFKRALASDPSHAHALGNYAVFLEQEKGDIEAAGELFERAVQAEPGEPNYACNLAGFLLAHRPTRATEGLRIVERLLREDLLKANGPALAECLFYALVHGPARGRPDTLKRMRDLLESGARSPGWDLRPHLAHARAARRADVDWLERLAAVITNGTDLSSLNGWDKWRAAS